MNGKKITKKRTKRTVSKQEVTSKKPSITIIEEIPMGVVELSALQAISMSLIRTAAKKWYVAIYRMNRTNPNNSWNSQSKVWLPLDKINKICELMIHSFEQAINLDLFNDYKPEQKIYRLQEEDKIDNPLDEKEFVLKLEGMTEKNLFED